MIVCLLLPLLLFLCSSERTSANCPNACNNRGLCDKYSKCHCADGFTGGDCSLRSCPLGPAWSDLAAGVDNAHNPAICSNRGICDYSFGTCTCLAGFTGAACERMDCSSTCNGNGRCYSMQTRAAKFKNSNSVTYTYSKVWDATQIQSCVCDNGFYDYQCAEQSCPVGDDPLTTNQVNDIQLIKCVATNGKFVLYFNGQPSTWIPYTASAAMVQTALLSIRGVTGVTVSFSQPNSPVCNPVSNIVSIQFTQEFGPLPPLVPQLDATMKNSGGQVSVSADGKTTFVDFLSGEVFRSQLGTKESLPCANRGLCSSTGVCSCYNTNGDAYGSSDGNGNAGSNGDCGYIVSGSTVSSCPGDIQCNNNGICSTSTHSCACADGWTSGDCSVRTCPLGLSWFDYPTANNEAHETYSVCSDMGTCDPTTGLCVCRANFYGEACQYMASDGGGGGTDGASFCTGNGRSLSMADLALEATNNGDAAEYTYGLNPNNPYTWDAHRIFGCLCDDGYEGYDCSLKSCPFGDDPGTYDDHSEVQLLQCIASGGYFKISFRQMTTRALFYNATVAEVQQALEQLPTIEKINVYFIADGPPPPQVLHQVDPPLPLPPGMPRWGHFDHNGNFVFDPVNITAPTGVPTQACSLTGTQIMILDFVATPNDVPAVIVDNSMLIDSYHTVGFYGSGTVNVFTDGATVSGLRSIKGTTEKALCNNRGTCNYFTGACTCFDGWSSSDGSGHTGTRGDCGWRNSE